MDKQWTDRIHQGEWGEGGEGAEAGERVGVGAGAARPVTGRKTEKPEQLCGRAKALEAVGLS